MKVLLIGASGYLGLRLYLDLYKEFEIVGTFHSHSMIKKFVPLDIRDQTAVNDIIQKNRPEAIIHVANNASGSWCEQHPQEAVALNQVATQHIVEAANEIEAKVVYISSFAVFDPSTVYGKTKLASEKIVEQTKAGYLIIRPSLIIGMSPNTTNDRPFNRILKNITEGTKAVYDTSWRFQPTYIGHVSEMIKAFLNGRIRSRAVSLVIEDVVSRYDIARDILKHFDIEVEPVDEQSQIPFIKEDITRLKEVGLSFYDYESMINKIVENIKNRDVFQLT